ncbi:hypothetical protein Pfo_015295 [Paulownia fortunei]|nr:hypothetical protein Pfo_015295 [Paulownia fortunei]
MIELSEIPVMSNNTNTSSTPSPSQIISINTTSLIPQKLSKEGNYSIWNSQMTNLFLGYDLIGFVDGTNPCPPTNDPEYKTWIRQDHFLLLAIQTVVIGPVGPLISLHMLNGLTNDYKELKTALCARESPISFEELVEKLLDYESSKNNNSNTSQNKPTYKENHSGHNWKNGGQFQQNSYRNHGNQNYFNNSYKQGFSSNYLNQNWWSPFNGSQSRVVCQLCDKPGHVAKAGYSGASRHITLDVQNLSIHSEYSGNEDIMVGDGNNVPNTHIRFITLKSYDSTFKLNNILCAPNIKKNLIFVS